MFALVFLTNAPTAATLGWVEYGAIGIIAMVGIWRGGTQTLPGCDEWVAYNSPGSWCLWDSLWWRCCTTRFLSQALMRPDELDRRLRERLDALGPAPRAELLQVAHEPGQPNSNRVAFSG